MALTHLEGTASALKSLLPSKLAPWVTQRGKGSLVHVITRDTGQTWTIFSVLLQGRAECARCFPVLPAV